MTTQAARELAALKSLATALGVATRFTDGLDRPVEVGAETLVRVCAALGAAVDRPAQAAEATRALHARRAATLLPPVVVAWDGRLEDVDVSGGRRPRRAEVRLEGGGVIALETAESRVRGLPGLPFGYHRLVVECPGRVGSSTVIAAPERSWRRPGSARSWGLGTHLSALRSSRSRCIGDLKDLESLCRWVGAQGGDLVTVLPLLPTFNQAPAEPSPYSPVSRLFWSELVLDLGPAHRPTGGVPTLDVTRADAEVRAALRERPAPDPATLDAELLRYARFRGAQARLGRDWRAWPEAARSGRLARTDVDPEEERFHLVAQTMVREQLRDLKGRLDAEDLRLGLDLAVGVHPDGYDPWSRRPLFGEGMSVGAPPDRGFPSGQDWGFSPVLPDASRAEGHRYLAASIAHQAGLSGVLRIDHIMALTRLYWIPQGFGLHEGTYVSYPAEELFAVTTLEAHRARCEVVGENLGTVPPEIDRALPRHAIRGMYLAEFEAMSAEPGTPSADEVALIGTHDTPTLAGWVAGIDIEERVRCGLLDAEAAPAERVAREEGVRRLAALLGEEEDDLPALLDALLDWLGRSPSPLVIPWIEDLWLEAEQVNLPGTRSSERPNWQRPMGRPLDEALADARVLERARLLRLARAADPAAQARPGPLASDGNGAAGGPRSQASDQPST